MRYVGIVVLLSCLLVQQSDADTVAFDAGTTHSVNPLTGFATTGDKMAGMEVTAFFNGGMAWERAFWAADGVGSGKATGIFGWSLAQSGDTYSQNWTLTNNGPGSLDRLLIDGDLGNTVFDVSIPDFVPPNNGTPGSAEGFTFQSSTPGLTVNVTYRDQVAILGNNPVGDLYRFLDIEIVGGLASNSSLVFMADTDNAQVPEPSSIAAIASLLGCGVGFLRRRRRSNRS